MKAYIPIFIGLYILSQNLEFSSAAPTLLKRGFKMDGDPTVNYSQPILSDQSGNNSLNFVHLRGGELALAIIQRPSGNGVLACSQEKVVRWRVLAQLIFNGSLIIIDSRSGAVLWSTETAGDRVVLAGRNLQIRKGNTPIWQSPDYLTPGNLTSGNSLISLAAATPNSGNRKYTFGPANFERRASENNSPPQA